MSDRGNINPWQGHRGQASGYHRPHTHQWSESREIGRTGDWFHPRIVEFKCPCGETKVEDV